GGGGEVGGGQKGTEGKGQGLNRGRDQGRAAEAEGGPAPPLERGQVQEPPFGSEDERCHFHRQEDLRRTCDRRQEGDRPRDLAQAARHPPHGNLPLHPRQAVSETVIYADRGATVLRGVKNAPAWHASRPPLRGAPLYRWQTAD